MNSKYNPEDDKEEVEFNKIQAYEAAKSPEAQQMALQALQEEAVKYNLTKEGVASVDNLKEFDARCKRADDIAREVFKDDPGQYDMYCSETGLHDAEQRKALAEAVQAEVKHGMQVAMKTDTEKRSETIANKDMLEAAGTLANVAADAEVATDATNSAYELVDSQHDFGVEQLARQRDEALAKAKTDAEKKQIEERFKTLKSGADVATVSARAAIGAESIKALTGISKREEDWARQRAGTLKKDFRNIFMQRYKAHLAMNQSHEIAYANAVAGTRDAAMKYFEARIKAGQVGSVLFTLDQLEKDGDAEFDKTVTEERPTGVYNPSYYSFLRKSDLYALRKAAEQMVEEARAEARSNESISLANSNAVLKSLVYSAQTQIDALYDSGDAVTPGDAQVLNKNLQDIVGKIDEMYAGNPKLVGNHVKQIKSYYRSAQARYIKTMNLASNCQNEADFKELLQKYNNATSEVSEIDVPEIDENGQLTGKTIKASVDTHKAYVITLNQARRAGFCKGAEWNTSARAHLEPQKRAHRIQAALNDFLVEKQGGQTGDSPAGRIALDVNADGTISVGSTNKELGKTFFDDADKGWVSWFDDDINVHPAVIRDVVKALDSYCISSLVTPTDEQLREQLNLAFNDAQAKNDARMFGYNFLESLRQRTAARFDPVLNREVYGNDRARYRNLMARYRYLEQRGLPVDTSLLNSVENARKSVESGKLQPSFQFLRNSIMPRSEQMKRRIAEQDNGVLDADDYIGDAEEP